MRFAILIPARLQSTRLPRKLLLDKTGLPLLVHTVDAALAAKRAAPDLFVEIVVAADDSEIVEVMERYTQQLGLTARVELTRRDHPSGSDRLAEVAMRLPSSIEAVVNLQGDEPEMPATAVVQVARLLMKKPEAALATLAYPIFHSSDFIDPHRVKVVIDREGWALYFSRSPIPFDRDGERKGGVKPLGWGHVGLYAYRKDHLIRFVNLPPSELERVEKLEQLRALENGWKIAVGLLETPPPKGIDTAEDYTAFVARYLSPSHCLERPA